MEVLTFCKLYCLLVYVSHLLNVYTQTSNTLDRQRLQWLLHVELISLVGDVMSGYAFEIVRFGICTSADTKPPDRCHYSR